MQQVQQRIPAAEVDDEGEGRVARGDQREVLVRADAEIDPARRHQPGDAVGDAERGVLVRDQVVGRRAGLGLGQLGGDLRQRPVAGREGDVGQAARGRPAARTSALAEAGGSHADWTSDPRRNIANGRLQIAKGFLN